MKSVFLCLFGVVVLGLPLIGLAAVSSPAASSAELENEARLLVQKQLLNKYVVESMDVVIKYNVFNIGGITATNVLLKDPSIGPDFEVTTFYLYAILYPTSSLYY